MADLKYVKVDKITGRKVVVSLKDVAPYWLYDTKTLDNTNRKVSFFSNINNPTLLTLICSKTTNSPQVGNSISSL